MEKFQIYYEPKKSDIRSFTLAISRLNEADDTYKFKIIKEVKNGLKVNTYKIKEFHIGVQDIIKKIAQIDFQKEYDSSESGKDMYYISADDNSITTSNKNQIKYILDLFQFDEIFNINVIQYNQIKDVYEFIKLNQLFIHKISKVSDETFSRVYDFYLHKNPYKVFENMNHLENCVLT